ncbi:hypothetical protein INT08_03835 [Prosthecochloris sp. N3]|uniref:Uncharacterized protein n=1 Tax=Prosthecochloris ethylica TaxID=2743976 RepID=A0ABR9XR75_9CHLB|nr:MULTISPECIES: hypothetical protein [Prosthecochloris]MBF0585525.1 hypothetical protein [Prosthecochloris ethylica]MBF0636311.1 hypothetical protein [Prosthecochloris ethylica]NUK46755.1 hypothetical protein [Prosthecochloris ethylica]RNA64663.1 hypothetical protein CR163_005055 [Prosthecochloris sp. ZM_2]
MQQVFEYPMTYPAWWLDYYYLFTWLLAMMVLAAGWAFFFRFGKFSYGIDLGCLWKSTLLLVLTTVSLGAPNYYNTRFLAEHGQEGDRVVLTDGNVVYEDRNGRDTAFRPEDIVRIYQEEMTFNPPPKIFIVARTGGARDSVFVTENLSEYQQLLDELSEVTGIALERP